MINLDYLTGYLAAIEAASVFSKRTPTESGGLETARLVAYLIKMYQAKSQQMYQNENLNVNLSALRNSVGCLHQPPARPLD